VSGLADEERQPTVEDLRQAIREITVGQFLLSTGSTLASLAFGKLEAKELEQAKVAIEAIQALMPVLETQVEPDLLRDFGSALANLKIAYADAVARPE
jgi:hypothetical protein